MKSETTQNHLYINQQANPQGDPNAQQGAPNDDGVYEADYREVDNDDNNQQ